AINPQICTAIKKPYQFVFVQAPQCNLATEQFEDIIENSNLNALKETMKKTMNETTGKNHRGIHKREPSEEPPRKL
ncbi:6014_t:CDS:1, partial [Ambispora gerdemannii]